MRARPLIISADWEGGQRLIIAPPAPSASLGLMLENDSLDTDRDFCKHRHTSGLVPNNKTSYVRFSSESVVHFQPIRDLERDVVEMRKVEI